MTLGATGQEAEKFFRAMLKPLWRDQERDIEERAEALRERFNGRDGHEVGP